MCSVNLMNDKKNEVERIEVKKFFLNCSKISRRGVFKFALEIIPL